MGVACAQLCPGLLQKVLGLGGSLAPPRSLGRSLGVAPPFLRSGILQLLILAASAVSVLSGCKPEPRADLVIVNGNEPESLDPAIVTAVPDMRIAKALFEGLARLGDETSRPPGLAERWEIGQANDLHFPFADQCCLVHGRADYQRGHSVRGCEP